MTTKGVKIGDIVAVTWKDHEMISDVQLKLALCMETLFFVLQQLFY